jgi:UDP-N-acetylglucosamine:LPS N-acetylglucosamine transferase
MNGNAYTSQPSCALILSGSMGKGHDSVAEACFATLSKSYAHVEILDCLKLLGRSRAAISETVYRMLLAVPTVYDGFYFSHIRSNSVFTGFLERASAKSLLPHLNRKILNTNPDLIVSVFPTGAGALGKLRNNFPNIPMVVIATDATVHAMWIHDGIDR